tara:strand:+ start:3795 stop:4103 length:309 start_codon:yes stop_codon:yes gene_type:complete
MMKITKRQLRRIIKEEKSKIMSEAFGSPSGKDFGLYDQIQEKLEYELLINIQSQILNTLPPAIRRTIDLGTEAEMMGFDDLMEQVREWFENYVSAMTDLDRR